MIEHLADHLSNERFVGYCRSCLEVTEEASEYVRAQTFNELYPSSLLRIQSSVRFPESVDWGNFLLNNEVQRYEAHFIRLALKESGGQITRAAHLLGLPSHQALRCMLENGHNDLRSARAPKRLRK